MSQPISFSAEEIARCLPPAGRYRVRVEAVRRQPAAVRPLAVDLRLRVISPPPPPIHMYHRLHLRGAAANPTAEMCRLLRLLHLAGWPARPDEEIQLECLIGLELFVDVRRAPTIDGFPFSEIAGYHPTCGGQQLQSARNATDPQATSSARHDSNACNDRGAASRRQACEKQKIGGAAGALSRHHRGGGAQLG